MVHHLLLTGRQGAKMSRSVFWWVQYLFRSFSTWACTRLSIFWATYCRSSGVDLYTPSIVAQIFSRFPHTFPPMPLCSLIWSDHELCEKSAPVSRIGSFWAMCLGVWSKVSDICRQSSASIRKGLPFCISYAICFQLVFLSPYTSSKEKRLIFWRNFETANLPWQIWEEHLLLELLAAFSILYFDQQRLCN